MYSVSKLSELFFFNQFVFSIEDNKHNPSNLIRLLESAFVSPTLKDREKYDILYTLMFNIKKLDSSSKLKSDQINRVMQVFLSNHTCINEDYFNKECHNFFEKHLNLANVYQFLSFSNIANHHEYENLCLDYLEKEINVKFIFEANDNLLMKLDSKKCMLSKVSTHLIILSEIYHGKMGVELKIEKFNDSFILGKFLSDHGPIVNTLELNGYDFEQKGFSFNRLTQHCPNLTNLSLNACIIKNIDLEKLQILKFLTKLELSNNSELKTIPQIFSDHLTEIHLINCVNISLPSKLPKKLIILKLDGCDNIERLPDSLPENLEELTLLNCKSLKYLPKEMPMSLKELRLENCISVERLPRELPISLEKLRIKKCSEISDGSRLVTLKSMLMKNFEQALKLVVSFEIRNTDLLRSLLVLVTEKKIADQATEPEELLWIANYIYECHKVLLLDIDHPLLITAMRIISASVLPGIKNPFTLFSKLKVLFNEVLDFSPQKMEIDGFNVFINMKKLKAISLGSKIKREDLPKNVSMQSYNQLISHLKNKVENNTEIATEALSAFLATWAEIEMVIINDPTQYLLKLLEITGENVGEIEAKWRAVLSNIFDQDRKEINGRLFNQQEEVFIKTIMGIQHCEGGKSAGIASSYELLEPKYRYPVKLSHLVSVDELQKENEKSNAFEFIKDFIKKQPINSSKDFLIKALTECINHPSGENFKFAHCLLEDSYELIDGSLSGYIYWDEDEESTLPLLNHKGGLKILEILDQEELEETCFNLMNLAIQKMMASQFTGTNALMQQLTGVRDVKQGSHQSIYLKNLIGHLVGLDKKLFFDLYTSVLYDKLLEKSRDEVLGVFFDHVTPREMIDEIVRFINQESSVTKQAFKLYLSDDSLWTSDDELNCKGALKLLMSFEYLKNAS